MKIRVINRSENPLPSYETAGSAGMDLRAYLKNDIIIEPLERILVSTGLFIEIPVGYEAQIRPRSGLAVKKGLTLLNTPGTIDSDYRGEIKIIMINLSDQDQTIKNGDRIAQMIISKHEIADWDEVVELEESTRDTGGFGHTGEN
ncbi:MAG: dUTP diphosphatase [Bacteroidetes bacterium]|nr:dUTP diphosphatase [Bacteroidota bacterium]